jgi:ABC-type transporter Mla subunit MlaD
MVSDESFIKELRVLVNNVNDLSNKMNKVISENRDDINKLTQNAVELTENTNNLIKDNRESVVELINNFNVLSKETRDLVEKINSFTDEINKRENNLGKILYDDELLGNLKSSIKQLETLTKILVDQLNSKGIKVDANIF